MEYSKFFRTHQTILIVDDEDTIIEFLTYALTAEGYDVVTANSGTAALAAMRGKRPHLVITDYMMPEMTGAQLAMEMRGNTKSADIPIILCTGAHIDQAENNAGLFSAILSKPFPLALLLAQIKQLMPALTPDAADVPSSLWRARRITRNGEKTAEKDSPPPALDGKGRDVE